MSFEVVDNVTGRISGHRAISMRIDVSIIIVNWNSKDYLRKCIQSIYANTAGISFEIIVVDGASFDGCGEMLACEFPAVNFIQSEKNVGFARANNLGFEHSLGESILFLNPDTELFGPGINALYWTLTHLEDAGIVGARLLNTDGSLQTTSIKAFPTILNQLLDSEVLRRRFPRLPLWGMQPLFAAAKKPAEVQVISGACMLVKRATFESVGKFDEDYFMYSEDVDLCFKASQRGCKNYFVPGAEIIHHGGCSTTKQGTDQFANVMMRQSRWRYFKKTRGTAYATLFRASLLAAAVARLGCIWICSLKRSVGKASASKAASSKWLAIAQWCMGLKPHFGFKAFQSRSLTPNGRTQEG